MGPPLVFSGKPLHLIAGKPLIQHVWERCQAAARLDAVIVATDDMRIAEAAFAFGAEVALTSPACETGTDRVAEVAARLGDSFSGVINVQGDEPTISPALIDQLAAALKKDRRLEMVTAASVLTDPNDVQNPNCVKVTLAKNGDALYFSRSVIPCPFADHAGGGVYYRHQGIYGYRRDFLKRFVRLEAFFLRANRAARTASSAGARHPHPGRDRRARIPRGRRPGRCCARRARAGCGQPSFCFK